jgi:Stage II sporulation protein
MSWPTRTLVRRILTVMSVLAGLLPVTVPASAASGHDGQAPAQPPAQAGRAELTGQVRDGRPLQGKGAAAILIPDGLPAVAGAVVSIPALGRRATTNAAGEFSLTGLRVSPGSTYTLVVRRKGFGLWQESGIALIPGDPGQVYVELHSAPQRLHTARSPQPYNGPVRGPNPAVPGGCTHNSSGWTSQTKEPPAIRVYMTGTGRVSKYDFQFYEEHVLPNEWIPSWKEDSLEAGAVAVRDYAWFFVVNGSKGTASGADPCSFDVDNTTRYQNFVPGNATYASTNTAVTHTAPYLYTHDSKIPELGYNSGFQGEKCGDETVAGSMSQWGTQACALAGDSWQKILQIYYGFTLHGPPGPAGVPGGPAVFNPLSNTLEVYGVGSDGGLRETYWAPGHGWTSLELPGSAGLAATSGRPSAVYDPLSNNLEVYATAPGGKGLEEYYYAPGKGWRSQLLAGPPSVTLTGSPSAVYDPLGKNLEVYITAANGGLAEIYWAPGKSWRTQELTGAPAALTGSPSAMYDPLSKVLEVYGTGHDATLEEYFWTPANGGWKATEPAPAGAPALTGSPSAVYDPLGGNLEVYGTAPDGGLAEYYYAPGKGWRSQELTGAPAALTGSPSAVYDPLSKVLEVYGTGHDATLEEYFWTPANGGWKTTELPSTGLTAITPGPFAVYDNIGQHLEVYALTTTSTLGEYYYAPGKGWNSQNLNTKLATL